MPKAVDPKTRDPQRFIDKCVKRGDCLVWTGAKSGWGYPVANVAGRGTFKYLHRYIFEHMVDGIPEGFVVDHICANPACLNPKHLQAIPFQLNANKGRTNLP